LLPDPRARWRTAALIAVASLFHTLPWIALNTSEARSLRRFETLPLGGGRTENTVAFWYADRHDFPAAKRWLNRALEKDPRNSRALDLVGRIAFEERHPRLALQAYLIAVTLRPDKLEYRRQLAVALAAAGGPDAGLRQLDSLTAGHPEDGAVWFERAMLLRAKGHSMEAMEAKARALALRPDLAAFSDRLPALHGTH
jgi:tetratricopeptide (TPR) repeat protein